MTSVQASPPNSPDTERLLTAQFVLLLAATAAFGLAFSAYFLLPKFLAVELSASPATIGGISAISMFASVLCMPVVGVKVDKQGRKRFGMFGAGLFALSCAGFLVVEEVGPLLWVLRVFQGAAFTLFYIGFSTLATDLAPARRLGQAIGLFGAVMISTNALGPAVAEWAAEAFGWKIVFGASVVSALGAIVLATFIHEPAPAHPHDDASGMLQVVRRPGLLRTLSAAILVGCTMGALFTFYQPWALSRDIEQVSSFLIAFAGCAMVVRVGLGAMADRLGRRRVATVAVFFYVAVPFALIWVDMFGLFFAGGLLGLSHGMFFPALNAVAVDQALPQERGKAMAAYHGAFNVGFAAGSYFLGYLAQATSYPTIFTVAGGTCFIAFVLLATTPRAAATSSGEV